MIHAIILIIIGIALMLSGIWEQRLFTIVLGAVIELVGWGWFFLKWRALKKEERMDNNE
ncbi:hypothetical protein [Pseudidiomarina insulisalsae]|uniref:hypothetical protein n=1 Tax=Pseudidiomarina insulisalsae TaxID=575789 RepID=UPI001300ADA6|nr:hypothetical protein [Pseudidiomarina insulisalsae]